MEGGRKNGKKEETKHTEEVRREKGRKERKTEGRQDKKSQERKVGKKETWDPRKARLKDGQHKRIREGGKDGQKNAKMEPWKKRKWGITMWLSQRCKWRREGRTRESEVMNINVVISVCVPPRRQSEKRRRSWRQTPCSSWTMAGRTRRSSTRLCLHSWSCRTSRPHGRTISSSTAPCAGSSG